MTPVISAASSGVPPCSTGRRRLVTATALLASAGLMGACASAGPAVPISTASMSAADWDAYEGASEAVVAYVQTVADLYTGARTSLDDLAIVAVAPELDIAHRSIAQARALGYRSEPVGAQVRLVSADPYGIELDATPASVLLKACIDTSEVITVAPTGTRRSGVRQKLEYRVVRAESGPASWVVSEVKNERPQDRAC